MNNGTCGCDNNQVQNGTQCNCPAPFVLNNNVCGCPTNQVQNGTQCNCPAPFVLNNNSCVCASGQVQSNNTCIQCPLSHCTQCATESSCQACASPWVPDSNQTSCVCEQLRTLSGSNCVCITGYTEFNNTCYRCSLDYCVTCSQDQVCYQCMSTFVISASSTCVCNNTYSVINNSCACAVGTT